MADFAFYTDVYLGSRIPEKTFPGMVLRAKEALERFQRIYRVTVPGEDSCKMALCAMAESLYAYEKHRGGVTGAAVGQVSVRYEDSRLSGRTLQRELYEKASIYLDICRGVEA